MHTKHASPPSSGGSWLSLAGAMIAGLALIGALAWFAPSSTPVALAAGSTWFVDDTGSDSNDCTAADALHACRSIERAVAVATGGDTISIATGTYTGTTITENLSLSASGSPASTIVDGLGTARVFTITADVTISGLTIQNGSADDGAGIHSTGALTITGSTVITNNRATDQGGGIYTTAALTVTGDSTVISNTATNQGGGIYADGPTTINGNSQLSSNHATSGGGLYLAASEDSTIDAATVQHNDAAESGGGIYQGGSGTLSLAGATVYSNTVIATSTDAQGGGLYIGSGTVELEDSDITENAAVSSAGSADGGGLFLAASATLNASDTATINNNRVVATDNTNPMRGGGIHNNGGTLSLHTVTVQGNTAASATSTNTGQGGGLFLAGGTTDVTTTTIGSNTSSHDGGGLYIESGSPTIQYAIIDGNTAGENGGGLFVLDGSLSVDYSTIRNNEATSDNGGGAAIDGGDPSFQYTTFSGNHADAASGGAVATGGASTPSFTNVTMSGNQAAGSGGALSRAGTGTTDIDSSTITDNSADTGGGIDQSGGTVNIRNTILAGNTGTTSGPDCSGTVTSQDYNLVGDDDGCTVAGTTTHNLSGDPDLGSLADNGGSTFTHKPDLTSPVIDAGSCDSGAIGDDQRGEPRPSFGPAENADDGCDIGAVEQQFPLQAVDDSAFMFPSQPSLDIDVLTNDTGAIDPTTVAVNVAGLSDLGGTLTVNATTGVVTYVPPTGLNDFTDTFTYTVKSTSGATSNEATVEIYVSDTIPCTNDRVDLLIAAIEVANSDPDHTTIYLTNDCEYDLTSEYADATGLPLVTEDLTIRGRGATIRRADDADDEFRLMRVDSGITLELYNLTLTGGYLGSEEGGAIYNDGGDVVLEDTSIVSNTATNGGGIYTTGGGDTSISLSSVLSNTATTSGGGIYADDGEVTLVNVTVSGNTAPSGSGGGIAAGASGTVNASSTTIAYNSSGISNGGVVNVQGTIIVENDTDCDDTVSSTDSSFDSDGTCGVDNDSATVPLKPLALNGGTTLNHKLTVSAPGAADNDAVDGGNCTAIGGGTVQTDQRGIVRPIDQIAMGNAECDAGSFELHLPVGGEDDAATTQGVPVVIDVLDNDSHPYDPVVTIDPTTVEIESAPVDGSTSINPTTGAVTYEPDASFVGGDMFRYTVADTDGWVSDAITVTIGVEVPCDTPRLIEAIEAANDETENPGHDTIYLSASCVYTLTNEYDGPDQHTGTAGLPDIYTPITIRGNGATIERLENANDQFRIFFVDTTGLLELEDLTITGGDPGVGQNGGAIRNSHALTLTGTIIENNVAINGGAVYNAPGADFRMDGGSTIRTNHATNGGGVYNDTGSQMMMIDSSIRENWTTANGGGLYSNGADLTLRWSSFLDNGADDEGTAQTDNGGGIYHTGNNVFDFYGIYISNNRATTSGGGIYNNGAQIDDITFARINGNQAGASGGAIYMTGATSSFGLERGRIYANQAANGGAFSVNGGSVTLSRMSVYENTATTNGAGFYVAGGADLTITTATVSGNAAGGQGGGVYNAGTTQINNSTVYANRATTNGGGIFNNSGGTVELYSTIVAGPTSGNPSDCSGTMGLRSGDADGFNLYITGRGCQTAAGAEDQSVSATQILLGDLRDSGNDWWAGPTHTPLEGSAAIDMGDCSITGEATDQHDADRPVAYAGATPPGDGCEVGSVEGIEFIVDSASPLPDAYPDDRDCEAGGNNGPGDPYCTLQSAIHEANLYPGRDVITFNIVETNNADGSGTKNRAYYLPYGFDRAFILKPATPFPTITSPLVINAESQAETQCRWDARTLKIVLDGGSISTRGTDGLYIDADDTTIMALGIQNFTGDGVEISNSDNARIFCNNISNNGTDPVETYGGHGVNISDGSSDNRIGETWWNGDANTISLNGGSGVSISSPASHRNRIFSNSIFQNGELGIDLAADDEDSYRVNPNDDGDYDDGPNALQNYPEIETATIEGDQILVTGRLNSAAGTRYRLQFFANSDDSCDPTNGEGEIFVGESYAITNTNLNNTFSYAFDIPQGAEDYRSVSATATDEDGNTSEFSICAAMNSSIGDRVWEDTNANGVQDDGEPGIPDVAVSLYTQAGTLIDTRTTDADGLYGFGNLITGRYYLVVEQPEGYVFTALDQGSDDELDSDLDPATGETASFLLPTKTIDQSRDVGLMKIGVTITESGDSTDVTEGGATDDYTIVLDSMPSSDVTVQISSPGNQVQAIPNEIVFTPDTWNVPRTVQVEAIDDAIVEGNHTGTLQHTFTSSDYAYNGELDPMTVNIVDNDTAGVEIDPTSVEVSEDGDTASYDVRLTYEPTATVRVEFVTDTQIEPVEPIEFTLENWQVPQRVTVRAVDDSDVEGTPHPSIIIHNVISSDPYYNGITVAEEHVAIADNDGPGVRVDLPSQFQVSEEGETTVNYFLSLTSKPVVGSSVTISVAATIGQVTVTPSELTFDSTNWNTPKAVQVRAIDDDFIEGPHVGIIGHSILSSSDPAYQGITIPDAVVDIVDNDKADVVISPSSVSVNEQGETTADYFISLAKQPTANVTLNLATPDGQTTVTPNTFIFTPANWKTPKQFTVKAVDDTIVEGPHSGRVQHTATSADPAYNALTIPDLYVSIVDNDRPGVEVIPTTINVAEEDQTSDSYIVRLSSQPTNTVTINITADAAQVTVVPDMLTFDASNWDVEHIVTVQAVDDTLEEGTPHRTTIRHAATTSDGTGGYNGIAVDDVDVSIVDNDTPGVSATPLEIDVVEGGATASFEVVLTKQPADNVEVTMTTNGQSEIIGSDVVTFTAATWKTPKVITVRAVDDAIAEGIHADTIQFATSSSDPDYATDAFPIESVHVNIADNDSPGVNIIPLDVEVSENGVSASYEVVLMSQPTGSVNLDLTFDNAQIDVRPPRLTFDATNWNTPHRVDVRARDDLIAEGTHNATIRHALSSSDPNYNDGTAPFIVRDVSVRIIDNDTAGVEITPLAVNVSEDGDSATYEVRLGSQPQQDVTINMGFDNAQVRVVPPFVTFEAATWTTSTVKIITVYAVDDTVGEGPHSATITHSSSSSDPFYAAGAVIIPNVRVNIDDNETAGVNISKTRLAVSEDSNARQDTYNITLNYPPTADVTVNFTMHQGDQVTIIPPYLTFTPSNWNVPKQVTVRSIDDSVTEGTHSELISHSTDSTDPAYATDMFAIDDVHVTITDNDSPGVGIAPTSIRVSEDGTKAYYDVRLNSAPTSPVLIQINPVGGQVRAVPIDLTFDATNWDVAQRVTVQAVDDDVAEGLHNGRITHSISSLDPNYNGSLFFVDDVNITIDDNDSPGVTISPQSVRVSEDGTTATYDVWLNSEPTANVRVTLDVGEQVTARPPYLDFDASNWDAHRTVTVYAVDDFIAEGLHSGRVRHTVSSSDPMYAPDMFAIADVDVTIDDNDSAGVSITPTQVQVSEDGATDTYDVKLSSQPLAPVTLIISNTNGQVESSPVLLLFDATNWDSPRTVTVSAIDDLLVEGMHTSRLIHTISSDDPNYAPDMFAIADVEAIITDNDSADVVIEPTSVEVSESGITATYSATLTAPPQADVVLSITPDAQLNVSPASITIKSSEWYTGHLITVAAVDDALFEGLHTGTIVHSTTSDDPLFISALRFDIDDETARITDNDAPGVLVAPTEINISEDGATGTYSVSLTTVPSQTVQISMTFDSAQVSVSPAVLTFSDTTPQTVTVAAVDDTLMEGAHSSMIRHNITSADPNYDGTMFAISDVRANIEDNDGAGLITVAPLDVNVAEEGETTDQYEVFLTEPPTGLVEVLVLPEGTQATVSAERLFFSADNWTVPQTVTVQAVDDAEYEGDHIMFIRHEAYSDDPVYDQTEVAPVTVHILDNELPPPVTHMVYLPITLSGARSDLSGNFTIEPAPPYVAGQAVQVTVTISNQGMASSTPFWVEFSINPSREPDASTSWQDVSSYGITWYVTEPIEPGESITLTSTPEDYLISHTDWQGSFRVDAQDLYLYVDVWSRDDQPPSSSGSVPETNEDNNLFHMQIPAVTGSGSAQVGQ